MDSIDDEIKTLCRLCGENDNEIFLDIFQTNFVNKISLNKMILSVLNINTTACDILPKRICLTCKNTVIDFYNFKEKCSKVDEMFQQVLQNSSMIESNSEGESLKYVTILKPLEAIYVRESINIVKKSPKEMCFDSDMSDKQIIDSSLQCFKCLKVYSTRSSLFRHRKICITANNKMKNIKFSCDTCQEILTSSLAYKLHKEKHNQDQHLICEKLEKPVKTVDKILCQFCGKLFKKANDLKIHLISHTKIKAYKCPDCDKTFSIHSRLKDHMNQHLNEKKFSCKICKKSFFTYRNLYKHNKIHDSQYRRHHCALCPKLFAYPYQLQTHMMVHTGNRPYICQLCDAKFRFNWDLQKHITKNHIAEKLNTDVITTIMYEDVLESSDINIINLDEYTIEINTNI